MNKKDVKDICFELLESDLKVLDYKKDKKDNRFKRTNSLGFDSIYIAIYDFPFINEYHIEFLIQIRVNKVQKWINIAENINEDMAEKTATCIVNPGLLLGKPDLKYITHDRKDIENAVKDFLAIFRNYGLQHIQKCYDINYLNTFYKLYGLDCRYWFSAFNWYFAVLTVAFFADKSNFPKFRKSFISYLISELDFSSEMIDDLDKYLDRLSTESI